MRTHFKIGRVTFCGALTALVLAGLACGRHPAGAAWKTFAFTLTTNAATYRVGDEIALTMTESNVSRQPAMLSIHKLTNMIGLTVKDADGNVVAHKVPPVAGPDEMQGQIYPPGGSITRNALLSEWGYHLGPGAYSAYGMWEMYPSLELVKSNVVEFTVLPKEGPPTPSPVPEIQP